MMVLQRQRGVALLTVLLVFALASFMARDMMITGLDDTQTAIISADARQAFYYALGGEAYARELLWLDRDKDIQANAVVDGKNDLWPGGKHEFELDEGRMQIAVSDLQGRINLAGLISPGDGKLDHVAVGRLRRALGELNFGLDLAVILADWVDADQERVAGGAEDEQYRQRSSPMLAGNTAIGELGEINRIVPLSDIEFRLLSGNLTSLPEATKLNVNTAGLVPMLALDERISRQSLNSLLRNQEYKLYASVEEALRDNGLDLNDDLSELLTTGSSWFQIEVVASFRDSTARLRTVVFRDPDDGVTRSLYRTQVVPAKVE